MSTLDETQSDSVRSLLAEQNALLQRLLELGEKSRSRGRLELVIAILLSLATLTSTWCGYQSGQWGGQQSSQQAAADTAERKAAENTIVALQRRTQDGLLMHELWKAVRAGDLATELTIRAHMSTLLKNAVQASIDDGILTNPEAPGPLEQPEYRLTEEVEAAAMRDQAKQLKAEAAAAGHAASKYVLLTIISASVLFFGGIGGTFTDRRIRVVLASVALLLFVVTVAMLLQLPVFSG